MGGKSENKKTSTNSGTTGEEDGKKEESFSLNQMKEILKMQEESIMAFFNSTVDRLENKIEKMRKEISDLKQSIEFNGNDINSIKVNVKNEVENIYKDRKEFVTCVEERLADQEDRDRRNNLRFNNIPEDEEGKESWDQCEEKVIETIKKLGIDTANIRLERAHRVGGKRIPGKKRGILCKFTYFKDKDRVLREYRRQKYWEKRDVFINEDFSDFTTNLRRRLFAEVKTLRERGEYARVVYNRIVRRKGQHVEDSRN